MRANAPPKLRSASSFARPKTTHWLSDARQTRSDRTTHLSRHHGGASLRRDAHAAALRHQPGAPLAAYRLDCSLVLLSARQLGERGGRLTRSVLES